MMELELPAQDLIFRGNTIIFIFSTSFTLLNVRITNDAREDEMEENMQQVGSSLGILKNMAEDLGQTIDGQNKQIEKIGAKVTIRAVTGKTESFSIPSQKYIFAEEST